MYCSGGIRWPRAAMVVWREGQQYSRAARDTLVKGIWHKTNRGIHWLDSSRHFTVVYMRYGDNIVCSVVKLL